MNYTALRNPDNKNRGRNLGFYWGQYPLMVALIGTVLGLASIAQAQEPGDPSACYMRLSRQPNVNLAQLCGHTAGESRPAATTGLSTAEKQDNFLKKFYQQVQQHPQGQEVLAQVDRDAVIGKANLVCAALKDDTYEPPLPLSIEDQALRKTANLEEAIVEQVARQSLCPEFK